MDPKKRRKLRKPRLLPFKYLIGGVCLAVGIYCVVVYVQFESVAVRTQAKVVDLRSESHATGRRGGHVVITRPVVEFDTIGTKEHIKTVAKTTSRENDIARGQTIEVAYDPARPDESVRIDTGLSLLEIGTLLFGALLTGFAMKEQFDFRRGLKLLEAPSGVSPSLVVRP